MLSLERRGALLATAALVLGCACLAAGVRAGANDTPVVVVAPAFELTGSGDASPIVPPPPVRRFVAARALVPELQAYESPGGTADTPIAAPNPTWEGFPLVVQVIETSPDDAWSRVRLPMRPNDTTGWVRSTDLETWTVPNRVEVVLATRSLRVYDGDSETVLFETDVGVGRGATPTPVGEFYIDIVYPLGNDPVYGWGQLSVAGFSDVLERFGGGIGQIALHGWNNDNIMGSAVSNGCVRMRNADIARVAELAPLGTPVIIRA